MLEEMKAEMQALAKPIEFEEADDTHMQEVEEMKNMLDMDLKHQR
jgi:hypothetical protein